MPIVSIPEMLRRRGYSDAEIRAMTVEERMEELAVQYLRMRIDKLPPSEQKVAEGLFNNVLEMVLAPWKRPSAQRGTEGTRSPGKQAKRPRRPDDVIERVAPIFYADPMTAAIKGLGMT